MKFMKGLVMGLALLLASSAFAGTKANLHLNSAASVSGTNLKAGDYKLEWDGAGPDVEVSIVQGKNVVAKVAGKLVDLSSASQNNAALLTRNNDGSTALTGARFEGKKFALQLGESGMESGSTK